MKVIKKYKNRKLYDPEIHSYIDLKTVFNWVKNGENVLVVGPDKKDVTRETLLNALTTHAYFDLTTIEDLIKTSEVPLDQNSL